MSDEFTRYVSPDEDNARWLRFARRPGDIVISTRSKHGTTWMQMICALLVLQTPELPEPLGRLSPWLDWLLVPEDAVFERLDAQHHRRFIKTHTPLDGLPADPDITYIVVARHPIDAAISLYHQGDNLDRDKMRTLMGVTDAPQASAPRLPLHDWLVRWIAQDVDPRIELDSLPGVMWHLHGAWQRRSETNVVLVHYDDLSADLGGQMRELARRLGITVPHDDWPALIDAASFTAMRERAAAVAPGMAGVLKDPSAFFRRGHSGARHEELSDSELARYEERVAALAPADLLTWLHRA